MDPPQIASANNVETHQPGCDSSRYCCCGTSPCRRVFGPLSLSATACSCNATVFEPAFTMVRPCIFGHIVVRGPSRPDLSCTPSSFCSSVSMPKTRNRKLPPTTDFSQPSQKLVRNHEAPVRDFALADLHRDGICTRWQFPGDLLQKP